MVTAELRFIQAVREHYIPQPGMKVTGRDPMPGLIANVLSDHFAEFMTDAFGLSERSIMDLGDLSSKYNTTPQVIRLWHQIGIQSLYLLQPEIGTQDRLLSQRYTIDRPLKGVDVQVEAYRRAKRMIDLHKERGIMIELADAVQPTVNVLYGPRAVKDLKQFYRLGDYAHNPHHEHWGGFPDLSGDKEALQRVKAAVAGGRIVASDILGIQDYAWASSEKGTPMPDQRHLVEHTHRIQEYGLVAAMINYITTHRHRAGLYVVLTDVLARRLQGKRLYETTQTLEMDVTKRTILRRKIKKIGMATLDAQIRDKNWSITKDEGLAILARLHHEVNFG